VLEAHAPQPSPGTAPLLHYYRAFFLDQQGRVGGWAAGLGWPRPTKALTMCDLLVNDKGWQPGCSFLPIL
jgi:hypothetical protein